MPIFPYIEILKKSFEIARKNPWLWVFGLFIGGTTGLNVGGVNYSFPLSNTWQLTQFRHNWQIWLQWIADYPQKFLLAVFLSLVVALFFMLASGFSRAAVTWTAAKLSNAKREPQELSREKVNFVSSLKNSRKYIWQIIGLQVSVTVAFLAFLSLLATPVIYLFLANAPARALTAGLAGLAIFIPGVVMFGFFHIYGPIFVVLYGLRIYPALQMSFNLLRKKIKESILLLAMLAGVSMLFLLGLVFAVLIFSVPLALLGLFLLKLDLIIAFNALLVCGVIVGALFTIIMSAGFAVFQNIVWVLAVQEMVNSAKLTEVKEPALAAEPA